MARHEAMCPYCGEMINEKATVCKYCGRMLRCDCDVHDSGGDGWAPAAHSEDKRTGRSAEQARRRNRGKLWGCLIVAILLTVGFIGLASALIFGFINNHSGDFDEFWSELVDDGEIDADDLDIFDTETASMDDPVADLVQRYVGAFSENDHDEMAQLYVPEIRGFYEENTDEMLAALDSWFDQYGKEVDRFVPIGQDEMDVDDLSDAADALGITFDRAADAQAEVLFKDGDSFYLDLIVVEMDGAWYLYSAF